MLYKTQLTMVYIVPERKRPDIMCIYWSVSNAIMLKNFHFHLENHLLPGCYPLYPSKVKWELWQPIFLHVSTHFRLLSILLIMFINNNKIIRKVLFQNGYRVASLLSVESTSSNQNSRISEWNPFGNTILLIQQYWVLIDEWVQVVDLN